MMHTLYQLGGMCCTMLLFGIFGLLLRGTRNFRDFIIGDDGKYSLSRLQAVIWAVFIISQQFSAVLILLMFSKMSVFDLQFSENVLWILGISLGSYVTVKGITVNRIVSSNVAVTRSDPKLSDFVTGENGLDFGRFQMLIWTVLGVSVYLFQCNSYEYSLLFSATKGLNLSDFFKQGHLPDISGSFLVLMGLSQGAYVGKKLIPTFQVNEIRQNTLDSLQTQSSQLQLEMKYDKQNLALLRPQTLLGKKHKDKKTSELQIKQDQVGKINAQIADLQNAIKVTS